MAEYARFATFEADEEALQAMLREIGASDGPPEGIPATGVTVLADRAAGRSWSPSGSGRKRISGRGLRRSRR